MIRSQHRHHDRGAKYPEYVVNMFGNLSTCLYFSNYIKAHSKYSKKKKTYKTDLSEDDIISLKQILADAYKKSATNYFSEMTMEFTDRNKLLSKAFIIIDWDNYRLSKKLGLKDAQRRDLCIQIFGDPAYNMRYIHKIVNCSPLDDEKRFKIIRKMYGKKRFVDAVGAAMTIDANNSDFITYLVEYVMKMKKTKKRAPYLLAYANAFKTNKTTNFRLINEKFYRKNKKLIKELVNEVDIKYKKAFKQIKHSKDKNADKIMKKNKKKAKEAEKEEKKLKKDTTITI